MIGTLGSIHDAYLDSYFQTFPTAAVQAGRHDRDRELEHLTPGTLRRWLAENRRTREQLLRLRKGSLDPEDRLDAEVLLAQVEREIHDLKTRKRPWRDPLYWTEIIGNAMPFLLVRDDRPEAERLAAVVPRAREIPRLAADALAALSSEPASTISPELCRIGANQARASAAFFRTGLPAVRPADSGLRDAGRKAAAGLDRLTAFLERLSETASGSPRLGADYAETFRLGTGFDEEVDQVLADSERELSSRRSEAAAYGRSIWSEVFPAEKPPEDDAALLRRLFSRVSEDRARGADELVADYRDLVARLEHFVREKEIVTLPDPLTLWTGPSPPFFLGQSVGGIYAAGPYSPEAKTLWFLPVPSESAAPAGKEAFFRDFNHHFNVMITPHETIPGHYVQLKYASRSPRKVRALFPNGPSGEGWGTFCERLMLDEGWGGPLDRVAHLKKQIENVARTIVDIRVHTRGMTREELIRFATEEALQDEQFAGNMWTRSITSAPQLTFYSLGYRAVRGLYDEVRAARGASFRLKEFMDGMMRRGPVPVKRYRSVFRLPDESR